MKSLNRAGLLGLVFGGALAATVSGCDTSLAQQNFGPLTITNVYALDLAAPQGAFATQVLTKNVGATANTLVHPPQLPDVMLFSNTEPDKTSPFPPTYGGLRIEFSQPVVPGTVASQSTLSGATFCGPLASPALKLVDSANTEVASSVCYDPASDLGQHPKVILTLGKAQAFGGGTPFTCQAFTQEDLTGGQTTGATPNPIPEALKANSSYKIVVTPSAIQGTAGGAYTTPTGGNAAAGTWTGNDFTFKTADFAIMAIGYQDPGTGFYVWLAKPFPGFMKDLAPDPNFAMPTDDTPLMIISTRVMAADENGALCPQGAACDPAAAAPPTGAPVPVDSTRADGSSYDAFIFNDLNQFNISGDPRTVFVTPGSSTQAPLSSRFAGGRWEPGASYKLVLGNTLQSCNEIDVHTTDTANLCAPTPPPAPTPNNCQGIVFACATPGSGLPTTFFTDAGGTTKTYPFKASDGSVAVTGSFPANGSLAVPLYDSRNAAGIIARVQFSVPVDKTTVDGTTNVKITGPGGTPLPLTATSPAVVSGNPAGGVNNQLVQLTATQRLTPGATYTLSVSGVKAAQASLGAFPAFSATFTAANFRVASLLRSCHDFPFNRECSNAPAPDPTPRITSVDRGANQPLSLLKNDDLTLTLTSPASAATAVNKDTVTVTEEGQPSPIGTVTYTARPVKATGASSVPANTSFTMVIGDAAYALKCNQRYNIRATTALTDENGVKINAEGCNPAAPPTSPGDCSDIHFFTTEPFAPVAANAGRAQIGVSTAPPASGSVPDLPPAALAPCSPTNPCFSIRFNAPIQGASVDTQLAKCGPPPLDPKQCPVLLTAGGSQTNIPLNCPALGGDTKYTIWCQSPTALTPNTSYTVGEVFTTPVKIAPTIPLLNSTYNPANPANTIGTVNADQTSCSYTGSATRTFRTPC